MRQRVNQALLVWLIIIDDSMIEIFQLIKKFPRQGNMTRLRKSFMKRLPLKSRPIKYFLMETQVSRQREGHPSSQF